jgi:hypothetical protein
MFLTALIKSFKPHRYTTLRVEFPITFPRDCRPSEYEYLSSAEIESKALAVHTVLVKNYEIVPKRLRGTIMPILGASSAPRDKIVITCRVPDDAPVPLIRDALIQKFGGNCAFFD